MIGRYCIALMLMAGVVCLGQDTDDGWTVHGNDAPAARLRWTTEPDVLAPLRAAFASGKTEDFLALFQPASDYDRFDLLRVWIRLSHPTTGSGVMSYAVNAAGDEYVFLCYMVASSTVWRNSQWDALLGGFTGLALHVRVDEAGAVRYTMYRKYLLGWNRDLELPDSRMVEEFVDDTFAKEFRDLDQSRAAYLRLLHAVTGVDEGIAAAAEEERETAAELARFQAKWKIAVRYDDRLDQFAHAHRLSGRWGSLSSGSYRNHAWQERVLAAFRPRLVPGAEWIKPGTVNGAHALSWVNAVDPTLAEEFTLWRPLAYVAIQMQDELYVCYSLRGVHRTDVTDRSGWIVRDAAGTWTTFEANFGIAYYIRRHLMPDNGMQAWRVSDYYSRVWALEPEVPIRWRREFVALLTELPPGTDATMPATMVREPAEELSLLDAPEQLAGMEPAVAPAGWVYHGMGPGLQKRAFSTPLQLGPEGARPIHVLAPLLALVESGDINRFMAQFTVAHTDNWWDVRALFCRLYAPYSQANTIAYAHSDDPHVVLLAGFVDDLYGSHWRPKHFIIRVDWEPGKPARYRYAGIDDEHALRALGVAQIVRDLRNRVVAEHDARQASRDYQQRWDAFYFGRKSTRTAVTHGTDTYYSIRKERKESLLSQYPELLPKSYYGSLSFGRRADFNIIRCDPETRRRMVAQLPLTVLDTPHDLQAREEMPQHADPVANGYADVFASMRVDDYNLEWTLSELPTLRSSTDATWNRYWRAFSRGDRNVLIGYLTVTIDGRPYYACIIRDFDDARCTDRIIYITQAEDGHWIVPIMPDLAFDLVAWVITTHPLKHEADQAALIRNYRTYWAHAPTVPPPWRDALLPVLARHY